MEFWWEFELHCAHTLWHRGVFYREYKLCTTQLLVLSVRIAHTANDERRSPNEWQTMQPLPRSFLEIGFLFHIALHVIARVHRPYSDMQFCSDTFWVFCFRCSSSQSFDSHQRIVNVHQFATRLITIIHRNVCDFQMWFWFGKNNRVRCERNGIHRAWMPLRIVSCIFFAPACESICRARAWCGQ